ncbi:MAG: low temperature requirement protein A [Acidimicrobiia bacterium]
MGDVIEDRTVSFLELFCDLVYVVVNSRAAHTLAEQITWRSFAEFVVLFAERLQPQSVRPQQIRIVGLHCPILSSRGTAHISHDVSGDKLGLFHELEVAFHGRPGAPVKTDLSA